MTRSQLIQLTLSIAVAVLAGWLAFRGVPLEDFLAAMASVKLAPLLASCGLMFVLIALRVARWGVLVRALDQVPARSIFTICTIGYMGINVLPFRLGEFVRPVLLHRREGVPFAAGMASIVVERVLDLLSLLLLLLLCLALAPLPSLEVVLFDTPIDLAIQGRNALLIGVAILGLPTVGLVAAGPRGLELLRTLLGILPPALSSRLLGLADAFVAAVRQVGRPRALLMASVVTLLTWFVNVVCFWVLLFAFEISHVGILEASVAMLCLMLCLMLPAPPGFVGVFEAGAVAGLLLFGVPAAAAAAFGVVLHVMQVGLTVLVGTVSLSFDGMAFSEVFSAASNRGPTVKGAEE